MTAPTARAVLLWVLSSGMTGCAASDTEEGGVSGVVGAGGTTSASAGTSVASTGGPGGEGGAGTTGTGGASVTECLATCFEDSTAGHDMYQPLVQCVYCHECYVDCRGDTALDEMNQPICSEPGTGTTCDNKGSCGTCSDCAVAAGCADPYKACKGDPECVKYANCIAACEKK